MKVAQDILTPTPSAWVETVLTHIPEFLQDHANCERKASQMMMSFVAKYPNRTEIIPELIASAIEELEHFQQVFDIMQRRGIPLRHEIDADPYVNQILAFCTTKGDERFLDRLLVGSVVETRGAERFKLVYQATDDVELKKFYHTLWACEAKHGNIFVKWALTYFPETMVYSRLQYFLEKESEVMNLLPIRPAFH